MPVLTVNEGVNVSISISDSPNFDVVIDRGTLDGGVPGGSTGQLQFNDSGVFGGVTGTSFSSGNLSLGAIANIKITGGSAGQAILTDGTGNLVFGNATMGTVTSVGGTGSGLGFSLGGLVTSTGNLTLTVPTVTDLRTTLNIGNVANLNLSGNVQQLLAGTGAWIARGQIMVPFAFGDASPKTIFTVPGGTVITEVMLVIITAFTDAAATLTVGDSGQNDRLMAAADSLPSQAGTYGVDPAYTYIASTPILLTIAPGTSVAGSGLVIINYQ